MNTRLPPTAVTFALALASALSADAAPLRRLDLDVTGDGRPEIFVARAFTGAAAGDTFDVFTPQADGSLGSLGRLTFDPAQGFRVDAAQRRVVVLVAPETGPAVLSTYALEAGFRRVARRDIAAGDPALEREKQAQRRYWSRARKVETAAEASRGEPVWRDVATGTVAAGLRRLDGQGYTKARR